MSLKYRIILLLLVLGLVNTTLDVGISQFILIPEFNELEEKEGEKDVARAMEALEREIYHLKTMSIDWAAWDDSYQFVQDGNPEYVESNLTDSTFKTSNFNLIYIVNMENRVVYGRVFDNLKEKDIGLLQFPREGQIWAEENRLLKVKNQINGSDSGIILVSDLEGQEYLMMVAAHTILTSDEKGPVKGVIIMGRFITPDREKKLAEISNTDLDIQPLTDDIRLKNKAVLGRISIKTPYVFEKESDTILKVWGTYQDIHRNPVVLLRVNVPREITRDGYMVVQYAVLSKFVMALFALVILTVWLQKTVINPITVLSNFSNRIIKTRDFSLRTKVSDKKSELSRLGNIINRMVEEIEDLTQNLEEKIRERTAEIESQKFLVEETRLEIVERLSKAAEHRDQETGNHLKRVRHYMMLLGEEIRLTKDENDLYSLASVLHDIGKIGIPDNILLKPGKLTDEEWVIMRGHPKLGSQILSNSRTQLLKTSAAIALDHHEKWNGKGYPAGLDGETISYPARMLAVIDVFDALTAKRPYKDPWPIDKALNLIREESGRHFDPELATAFLSIDKEELTQIIKKYPDLS